MICDNRDETINHIISKCSKLAQKECKTIPDWVGRMIHWKLCKKQESALKNEIYKLIIINKNRGLSQLWTILFQRTTK